MFSFKTKRWQIVYQIIWNCKHRIVYLVAAADKMFKRVCSICKGLVVFALKCQDLTEVFYTRGDKIHFYSWVLLYNWTASSEFGTYRLCEQRRFRRACASAQSCQNLRCSLIQAVSQEEPSDRKPDPCPLWMAGHAQLKFVITECSKTQIRLTGLICEHGTFTYMSEFTYIHRVMRKCGAYEHAHRKDVSVVQFCLTRGPDL